MTQKQNKIQVFDLQEWTNVLIHITDYESEDHVHEQCDKTICAFKYYLLLNPPWLTMPSLDSLNQFLMQFTYIHNLLQN